jgi:hypothetical protein
VVIAAVVIATVNKLARTGARTVFSRVEGQRHRRSAEGMDRATQFKIFGCPVGRAKPPVNRMVKRHGVDRKRASNVDHT